MSNRQIAAFSVALAVVLAGCTPAPKGSPATPSTSAAEQPQPGGTLTFIVNAEPPSFDGHRETTFALLHPIAPHYSTLYKFDPSDLTKVAADVAAAMPEVSADKLTYTIKLRTDVKFHDGSKMTSDDILATYQKIIFPPTGVLSPRAGAYAAVDTITAPAPDSVIFKLKYPSASFATNLASPWNFIYSAAKLKADIHWYEKNIMGTGPFTYVSNTKGAEWNGKKFPDYFAKDKNGVQLPYLDGYKALIITDANAEVNAIRSKQAAIEFRGFTPQQRDTLSSALGSKLETRGSAWFIRSPRTAAAFVPGWAWSSNATAPATCGEDIEVPLKLA